jgi:hypothetical protein
MPNPQLDGLGPLGALRSTRKHPLQQGLAGDDIPPIDVYNLGHQRAHQLTEMRQHCLPHQSE